MGFTGLGLCFTPLPPSRTWGRTPVYSSHPAWMLQEQRTCKSSVNLSQMQIKRLTASQRGGSLDWVAPCGTQFITLGARSACQNTLILSLSGVYRCGYNAWKWETASEPQQRISQRNHQHLIFVFWVICENIYMINLRAPGERSLLSQRRCLNLGRIFMYHLWSNIKALNTLNVVWEKIPRAITNDTEEGRSLGN